MNKEQSFKRTSVLYISMFIGINRNATKVNIWWNIECKLAGLKNMSILTYMRSRLEVGMSLNNNWGSPTWT